MENYLPYNLFIKRQRQSFTPYQLNKPQINNKKGNFGKVISNRKQNAA